MPTPRPRSILACALLCPAALLSGQDTTATDSIGPPILLSRDRFTGRTTVPGGLLAKLPIDDPRQALHLVPGVVARGAALAPFGATQVSIRGGTSGQTGEYLDGAAVRLETLGTQPLWLSPLMVSELSVGTGVASASVWDGWDGVVSYRTPSGGATYVTRARAETDEAFGDGSSVGYDRFEGAVGGPVPGVRDLTFFAAARLQGQRSHYRGIGAADQPTYVLAGLDTTVQFTDGGGGTVSVDVPLFAQWSGDCDGCVGLRRPMDWATDARVLGKLEYTYGPGSRVSVTGVATGLQERFFPGQRIGAPSLYEGSHAWSRLVAMNVRHRLRSSDENGPTLAAHLSYAADRAISGPLTPQSELEMREPSLGIAFSTLQFTGLDVFPFPVTEEVVRNFRTNTGLRTPYLGRNDLANAQPYRLNPFGLRSGWPTQGLGAFITLFSERRLSARAQVEWAGPTGHLFTAGVDAGHTRVSFYTSNLLRQLLADVFVVEPKRFGLFAQDRVELGHATLEIGGRYDHFDAGGAFARVPGFIATHPAWDPADYEGSVATVMTGARGRGAFSPRVRFAYRVREGTSFGAAYGRYVQVPPYATLFANANSDLAFVSTAAGFGRDVDYAKVTIMEVWGRHAFGNALEVGVGAYRKTPGLAYGYRFTPYANPRSPSDTVAVNALAKIDDGDVIGLDANVAWGRGATLGVWTGYSLAVLRPDKVPGIVAGGDVATHQVSALVSAAVPEGWRRGTTLGTIADGLEAVAVFRATSGLPYTRVVNDGAGYVAPGPLLGRPVNASRLPWTKQLDLRLSRKIRVGNLGWTAYLDVRNLLNVRNTERLFAETGDIVNDRHRTATIGDPTAPSGEYASLWNEASLANALSADRSVDLRSCAAWGSPVTCVALRRVEARFGDGDRVYTLAEQQRALNVYYDSFFGAWRFYGPGRTARIGLELEF